MLPHWLTDNIKDSGIAMHVTDTDWPNKHQCMGHQQSVPRKHMPCGLLPHADAAYELCVDRCACKISGLMRPSMPNDVVSIRPWFTSFCPFTEPIGKEQGYWVSLSSCFNLTLRERQNQPTNTVYAFFFFCVYSKSSSKPPTMWDGEALHMYHQ